MSKNDTHTKHPPTKEDLKSALRIQSVDRSLLFSQIATMVHDTLSDTWHGTFPRGNRNPVILMTENIESTGLRFLVSKVVGLVKVLTAAS